MHSASSQEQEQVAVPDQSRYVQAGLSYLSTLHDLQEMFRTFDLSHFDVQDADNCVLAQASRFEVGRTGNFYQFLDDHVIPALLSNLGFMSKSDKETDALNACWVARIQEIVGN